MHEFRVGEDVPLHADAVSVVPRDGDSSRIEYVVRFQPQDPSALEGLNEGLTRFCRGNIKVMKRALGLA